MRQAIRSARERESLREMNVLVPERGHRDGGGGGVALVECVQVGDRRHDRQVVRPHGARANAEWAVAHFDAVCRELFV